ncbi:ArsR/SmtB family transcription factor [Actinoalloteichus spitiensis]|uniref:ArsR/SmtB family transcription factor n=1 Tax=Actinoalloteichus spitiensis TaxID=252394 RepID=UPI0003655BA9|nr:helix-turn-helix domain-containing protein [Actinoalloteichus spitiensis]
MGEPAEETRSARRVPATEKQAAALASSVRLRIIRLLHGRELTNKELAERLDRDPATVLYHVRRLVAAGFLVAGRPRRGAKNARAIPYRSVELSCDLELGRAERERLSESMLAAFLAEVGSAAPATLRQSRLVLELDEDGREEFLGRLRGLLHEFADRRPGAGARRYGVYVALHEDD